VRRGRASCLDGGGGAYAVVVIGDDSLPYTRSVFDRDYWLSHADGFAVDAARGRVGVVEEVRFGSRIDRPDFLVVRGGRFGRRRLLVPVEDVDQVRPRAKRLQLRPTADPLHHD
jgi:hypothetical protein